MFIESKFIRSKCEEIVTIVHLTQSDEKINYLTFKQFVNNIVTSGELYAVSN